MWSSIHRALSRQYNRLRRIPVKRRHVRPVFASVPEDARILEIGGGYNPRYVKSRYRNALHLDHCSTEELRAKYAAMPEVRPMLDRIQEVDFVSTGGPLDTVIPADVKFDVVFGSHVLEHQVDVIGHLQALERLLAPGGRVIQVIPDFRCCFDALRYPTVTSDLLVVHARRPSRHQGKQIFDALARAVDCNPGRRLVSSDVAQARFTHSLASAHEAMTVADAPDAAYHDVHAWTFCPESFRLIMIELRLLGLTRLECATVSPSYDNQFVAVLARVPEARQALSPADVARLEAQRLDLCKQLRF